MIKRALLPFLLLLFTATAAFAQKSNYNITGLVKDSLTAAPEPYVSVRLLPESGNKAVAVARTDDKGAFQLKAAVGKGRYVLEFSTIGKQTKRRSLDVGTDSKISVGDILLQENNATLSEASVTAQRRLVTAEIDRIGYSVKDDPEAVSSNMLDILRKVPMVTVDGEDNIQINGNSGFKVYVNGKPNEMMSSNPSLILKSYPATAVQKVEVITDPGAKYDAEGTGGILNIVTATNTSTAGYLLTPSIQWGDTSKELSLFGMTKVGKFTMSANYIYTKTNDHPAQNRTERETFADDTYHLLKSYGNYDTKIRVHMGSLNASYEFNDRNLLTLSSSILGFSHTADASNDYDMTDINGNTTYRYKLNSHSKYSQYNFNLSTDYQHTFAKEGQMLTLSYRFDASPQTETERTIYTDMENVPFDLLDRNSDPDTKANEHTAQVDFTTPIAKLHTLSTGLKYIYRINSDNTIETSRTSGTDGEFELNEESSSKYRHRTDIAAAYGEYQLKVKNFTTRAGLRYEWSKIKATYPDGKHEGFSSEFSDLVPSLNIGYSIKPTMMVKAAYDLRIGRPGISYLSPHVKRSNAETQEYGNPNLDSEKSNKFSISFNSFSQKLSVTTNLSYSFKTNGLTSYTFLNDQNISTTTYGNLLHQKQLQLNAYVKWSITRSTSLSVNFLGKYVDLKAYRYYGNSTARSNGFNANAFVNLQQTLPWKLRLNITGGLGTPGITLQGRGASYNFYSAGLSRSFLKEDRLTVSLKARTFFTPHRTMHRSTVTDTFRYDSYNRFKQSGFSIGISYRMGSLKTYVKKTERTISNDDVVNTSNESSQGQQGGAQ